MGKKDGLKIKTLISEIRDEVLRLKSILSENKQVIKKINSRQEFDFLMRRGQGGIIHDFYCGIERIFEKIAYDINGGIPNDPSWHQRLLHEMSLDIRDVRPSIISKDSYNTLKEYLSFRHLFRNVYGFELDEIKINSLSQILYKKGPFILKEIEERMNEFECSI